MSRGDRKAIIVRDRPDLSLSRQCRLLSIARSSVYYAAKGESPANLALMRRIDELFLKYPFYGSRQMARQLRREDRHLFCSPCPSMPPSARDADPTPRQRKLQATLLQSIFAGSDFEHSRFNRAHPETGAVFP